MQPYREMGEIKERHLGFLVKKKKNFKITLGLKTQYTDFQVKMKTCFVWSLYNDVMIKDEISNLVWIRLSVNSDLKILMNSSK